MHLLFWSFWNGVSRIPIYYDPVEAAGGINIAAGQTANVYGYSVKVPVEQVVVWNPDFILIHGAPKTSRVKVEQILQDPRMADVNAVVKKQVYYTLGMQSGWHMPRNLTEMLYMAKLFHPDKFKDLDPEAEGNAIYERLYGKPGCGRREAKNLASFADSAAVSAPVAEPAAALFTEAAILVGLAVTVAVLGLWAATIGPAGIGFFDAARTVVEWIVPGTFDVPKMTHTVIVNIRLPRILMADLAGFGLGMSGFAMQAVLRNPLASPYTLGISAAAGFGASLAIVLGIGILSEQYMIVGNAFFFALIASALVLLFSVRNNSSPETVILTGVAMMFLFSAGITLLQYLGDPYAVQSWCSG